MVHCAGCERPILDRFLLNVLDRTWHAKCVQCSVCKCVLAERCFSRDGRLFCRADFFRYFGTKCSGCSQGISPNDLVRRAKNGVFHLNCFTCMICRKQLSTGEELYIMDENKFICKEDFLNSKFQGSSDMEDEGDIENILELQSSFSDKDYSMEDETNTDQIDNTKEDILSNIPNNDNVANNNNNNSLSSLPSSPEQFNDDDKSLLKLSTDSNHSSQSCDTNGNSIPPCSSKMSDGNHSAGEEILETSSNSGTGPKRRGPRTTIKAKQLETLKSAFTANPKPTRHIREQLAQETGLSMRVIQVWFQNRRSKERRMKQLSALGVRRQFFRNPRRMRALRAGMSPDMDDPDMIGPGFGYFSDNGQEFFPGYQGYGDFLSGQVDGGHGPIPFLPPTSRGTPPLSLEQSLHHNVPDGQYLPSDMMPTSGSPEPMMSMHGPDGHFGPGAPHRSNSGSYTSINLPHPEMTEAW